MGFWTRKLRRIVRKSLPVQHDYLNMSVKMLASHIAETEAAKVLASPVPDAPPRVGLKSKVSTQEDIEAPWARYWIDALGLPFSYHRKHWEMAYVLQALFESGAIGNGKKGLGLACGRERVPSFLIAKGCRVDAGDKPDSSADSSQQVWKKSNLYTKSAESLYYPCYLERAEFDAGFNLVFADMNALPENLREAYDFCWSICAVEHLGSVRKGLDFLCNSLSLLKPGGVSVHTMEFDYLDTDEIRDNRQTVAFKREHMLALAERISGAGGFVEEFDFSFGKKIFDRYIDVPAVGGRSPDHVAEQLGGSPYMNVLVGEVPCSCFGVIIGKST